MENFKGEAFKLKGIYKKIEGAETPDTYYSNASVAERQWSGRRGGITLAYKLQLIQDKKALPYKIVSV